MNIMRSVAAVVAKLNKRANYALLSMAILIAIPMVLLGCPEDTGTPQNPYVCENGTPTAGNAPSTGAASCTACNTGYRLSARACIAEKYVCPNGTKDPGNAPSAGVTKCTACDSGYQLSEGRCFAAYECENGTAKTGIAPSTGMTNCTACNSGFRLNATASACDDVPPPAVTITGEVQANSALGVFTWTDPTDSDLDGIEITYQTGSAAAQTVTVKNGVGRAVISGLASFSSYSFTAKSVDAGGNKSPASNTVTLSPIIPVALFSLGAQDGDFGFPACQTALNDSTSGSIGAHLKGLGYTKAVFFGSTPDYSFPDIETDVGALGYPGDTPTDTQLAGRPVVVYTGASNPTTTFGSGSNAMTRTIGNVVNIGVATVWQTGGADVVATLGVSRSAPFWSFTESGNNGYDSDANCDGATNNLAVSSTGSTTGATGDERGVAFNGHQCDTTRLLLCAAH